MEMQVNHLTPANLMPLFVFPLGMDRSLIRFRTRWTCVSRTVSDWRVSQQKAVEDVCAAKDTNVWVAIDAGSTVGFVAVKLDSESSMGEIYMIAVDQTFNVTA